MWCVGIVCFVATTIPHACLPCCRFVTVKYCKFWFDRKSHTETIGRRNGEARRMNETSEQRFEFGFVDHHHLRNEHKLVSMYAFTARLRCCATLLFNIKQPFRSMQYKFGISIFVFVRFFPFYNTFTQTIECAINWPSVSSAIVGRVKWYACIGSRRFFWILVCRVRFYMYRDQLPTHAPAHTHTQDANK